VTRSVQVRDFASFREAARQLVAAGVPPAEIVWSDPAQRQVSLFAGLGAPPLMAASDAGSIPRQIAAAAADDAGPTAAQSAAAATPAGRAPAAPRVPRRYVALAEIASLYRDPDRFALLYRVLYRLTHGEPGLLEDEADPDVRALASRAQSVRKDEHRMHAFVRFRKVELDGVDHYIAWYAPEHHILRLGAPFFQRRFAAQRWSILTPDESAHWDGEALTYGPGAPRSQAPQADELEALFRTYYSATYNPARANLALFRKHVPPAFARHMPELEHMPTLLRPQPRESGPAEESAAPLVPSGADLPALRAAAASCRACPAGDLGGQTVFSEGPAGARLCLIGEQPGDEEDRRGRPFVGPAGQVLDRALAEAQLERDELYVTNAVKHFIYVYRGKRRLHSKPSLRVVRACRPWLDAELEAVQPEVIVCLGATAAQSFLGPRFSVTRNRGRVFETPWAKAFIVTYHPSAILRMEEAPSADAYRDLVRDLTLARSILLGEPIEALRAREAAV
jgi:uracil-DNA glycosylase